MSFFHWRPSAQTTGPQRSDPAAERVPIAALSVGRRPSSVRVATEQWVNKWHGPGIKVSARVIAADETWSELLVRRFSPPCFSWLATYSRADGRGDLFAGLTVAVVLVPQALAYALLVDLPSVYGLYTAFIPLIVFATMTTSRHTCIGPSALMSIVVAMLAHDVAGPGASHEDFVDTVLGISIGAGAIQLCFGMLGLGQSASLLPDSSVAGFTTASVCIIAASQLHHILGRPIPHGTLSTKIVAAADVLFSGEANWWAIGLTLCSLCFMIGAKRLGKRLVPSVPVFEQLLALVVFTALAELFNLRIPRVGDSGAVPSGLPRPRLPAMPQAYAQWEDLMQASFTAALTSFLLSMSIVRTFALRHRYVTDASQELLALGMANLLGGFFGAYPCAGSLSKSALCSSVGGHTPLHGLVQAGVVCVVLLGCTFLFNPVPFAVLAAIILAALLSLFDFDLPLELWRTSRVDFCLWSISLLSTLLLGVQPGLAISIASSLASLIASASRPPFEVLGRLPGTDLFRDVLRYPCAQTSPTVLVFRFGAPLHFANVEFFIAKLRRRYRWRSQREALRFIVLDCGAISDMDWTAHAAFVALLEELRLAKITLLLAALRHSLRDTLAAHGTLGKLMHEGHLYVDLDSAVELGCVRVDSQAGTPTAAAAALARPQGEYGVLSALPASEVVADSFAAVHFSDALDEQSMPGSVGPSELGASEASALEPSEVQRGVSETALSRESSRPLDPAAAHRRTLEHLTRLVLTEDLMPADSPHRRRPASLRERERRWSSSQQSDGRLEALDSASEEDSDLETLEEEGEEEKEAQERAIRESDRALL